MAIDSGRLKHLEMIQQVITRMAGNSFLIKGWSVTLMSALLALSFKEGSKDMAWIALLPWLMFWILDGFFLRQERLFRKLWDARRVEDQAKPTDFDMDTGSVAEQAGSWLSVIFSKTLLIFHGGLFVLLCVIIAVAR